MKLLSVLSALVYLPTSVGRMIDFEIDAGGISDLSDDQTALHNGALINSTLSSLSPGDTLLFPNKTFHTMGGIVITSLRNATVSFDGTLVYSENIDLWPKNGDGGVFECMRIDDAEDVVITSSGKGTLDGRGKKWWGLPGIGYLERQENRPRLLTLNSPKNVKVENILFKNSPYWTFWAPNSQGLEIAHCDIFASREDKPTHHGTYDLTAFNTDGFDVTGDDVWIHDCTVWNQDDCVAVKDGSTNMLIERVTASGVGLTIGSIGGSTVRNITFRDCHMPDTYKGIYMKFRDGSDGLIEDVTFENIVIDRPTQWPIWIGPAQQSDSNNPCAAHPCSICWPDVPLAKCSPSGSRYNNILLKNVTINSPAVSSSPSPRPSSPSSSPSPTPSSPPRARTPPSPPGAPTLSSSGATA